MVPFRDQHQQQLGPSSTAMTSLAAVDVDHGMELLFKLRSCLGSTAEMPWCNARTCHKTTRPRSDRLRVSFALRHITSSARSHTPATKIRQDMARRQSHAGHSIGAGLIFIRFCFIYMHPLSPHLFQLLFVQAARRSRRALSTPSR